MAFLYKTTSRAGSKTCPPCVREGGVSVQRTPGGLSMCKPAVCIGVQ